MRTESPTTLRTGVGLDAGMDENMLLHVAFLVEGLRAVDAYVRADVGVDEKMCGERGSSLQPLVAHGTYAAAHGGGHVVVCCWGSVVRYCGLKKAIP